MSSQIEEEIAKYSTCALNRNISQWLSLRQQTDHSSFSLRTRLNAEEGTISFVLITILSDPSLMNLKTCHVQTPGIIWKTFFFKIWFSWYIDFRHRPQCSTKKFTNLSRSYGFVKKNSSPHFEQSNLETKRTIQTLKNLIKNLIKKATDPYRTILTYRNSAVEAEPLLRNGRVSKEISMRLKARKWQHKINIDKHEEIIDSSQTKRKCIYILHP